MNEPGKSDRSEYPGDLRSEPEARQSAMDYWTFYEQMCIAYDSFLKTVRAWVWRSGR